MTIPTVVWLMWWSGLWSLPMAAAAIRSRRAWRRRVRHPRGQLGRTIAQYGFERVKPGVWSSTIDGHVLTLTDTPSKPIGIAIVWAIASLGLALGLAGMANTYAWLPHSPDPWVGAAALLLAMAVPPLTEASGHRDVTLVLAGHPVIALERHKMAPRSCRTGDAPFDLDFAFHGNVADIQAALGPAARDVLMRHEDAIHLEGGVLTAPSWTSVEISSMLRIARALRTGEPLGRRLAERVMAETEGLPRFVAMEALMEEGGLHAAQTVRQLLSCQDVDPDDPSEVASLLDADPVTCVAALSRLREIGTVAELRAVDTVRDPSFIVYVFAAVTEIRERAGSTSMGRLSVAQCGLGGLTEAGQRRESLTMRHGQNV